MTLLVLVPSAGERAGLTLSDRDGVTVATCGVGLVDAAVGTERLLVATGARRCLLAGLAGTRDPDRAPVGSVVVGRAVINEGVGAGRDETFVPLDEMEIPTVEPPPGTIELTVPAALAEAGDVRDGAIGTVAAAAATPDEARARQRRRPDVLAEEMEGWAVARVCAHHDVTLSIVRSISNVCGDRDRGRWDFAGALAALSRVLATALDRGP